MARPSLLATVKFKGLVRALGLPRPYVVGLLEVLWICGYEAANAVIGTPDEIEMAAEWPGEPGKLFEALKAGRWIDPTDDGRWAIHDLYDHAPEYVRKRMDRRAGRDAKGRTLEETRSDAAEKAAAARWGTGGDEPSNGAGDHNGDASRLPHGIQSRPGGGECMPHGTIPTKDTHPPRKREAAAPPSPPAFLAEWNAVPGVRFAKAMTKKRTASLSARCRQDGWLADYPAALAKIPASAFLMGRNDRGWVADIDWFLRADTVITIIEGKYDDRQPAADGYTDAEFDSAAGPRRKTTLAELQAMGVAPTDGDGK